MAEAASVERRLQRITDIDERKMEAYQEQKRHFGQWDAALDQPATGPRWLSEPQVAQLLQESLHYRDGKVYDLDTFCIMSNHAHLLFTPLLEAEERYHALSAIMQSLKGFTARKANLILKREGQFWQHESYDHVVRNERKAAHPEIYFAESGESWPSGGLECMALELQ